MYIYIFQYCTCEILCIKISQEQLNNNPDKTAEDYIAEKGLDLDDIYYLVSEWELTVKTI